MRNSVHSTLGTKVESRIDRVNELKWINGQTGLGTMGVGPLNHKVTTVNGLGDPRGSGSNLVWSMSFLWDLAHNLN